jgi:hypothetical protein
MRIDPRIISIHPFTGQRGATFTAMVRGTGLRGASSASLAGAPFTVSIEGVEAEAPSDTGGRNRTPVDLVRLQISVAADARPGRYPFRLLARNGISNAVPILISEFPVTLEPAGMHETRDSAVSVAKLPAVFAGRLTRRGEADYYSFHADAGQTLSFAVISGFPQIAAAGSAATVPNFDPSLSIYEAEGSWFDPSRLKRIAYNDEPVWVFGRSTDAHLAHRFAKSGTYFLRVEAFAGQGGPDYSYQLAVAQGEMPQPVASASSDWEERAWNRRLDADRLKQLSVRGGKSENHKSIETWRAASEAAIFKLPGTLEGVLAQPGETHRARFRVDQPADIAIEVQTPAAAPPFFNPVVRLLDGSGTEVATNIFAGRGACSGALTKSMQSKTIVPLRDTGDYTLEIRDATADLAVPDFAYRVQVRPQIPHVGQIRIDADHVNLAPGEAKTITVAFDREEDYRGGIAVVSESLPPDVSAVVGADFEPDKDPPSTVGRRERYTPRTERVVVVLSASANAAPSAEPHAVRFLVRPLVDGKIGDILLTKSLPVMVIQKP